jgi:hypothetical protein
MEYDPPMDTGDLRKRILHALDAARKESAERRRAADEAAAAYERFLSEIAAPMIRQAASVLCAEKHRFTADTPAGSVRLSSETSAETFLEITLDASARPPQVIGRVSVARGRQHVLIEEHPIAKDKGVADLVEDDVAQFLVANVSKLVAR